VQLCDDIKPPTCCYSAGALNLLAVLLRCDASLRHSVLEDALTKSSENKTRRAVALDLIRNHAAPVFLRSVLPNFCLNGAGLVCLSTISEASSNASAAAPAVESRGRQTLLLPSELAIFVISSAAASLHAAQSCEGAR
jgi:hypothetical protein